MLFAIGTVMHGYQVFRYRTWYFIPMVIGTLLEIVGYIFRCLSGKRDPYNVIYFVVQYFFIVVAPVFFSAAIYTILSKLIQTVGCRILPIGPRALLIIFIISDVIATVTQIAGAASVGSAESNRTDPSAANHVLLAGLVFQVFTFLVFLTLLVFFLYRARKISTSTSMKAFSIALVVATLLVYLRTCFRMAETAQGLGASLSTHEAYFGCLEFAPVVIAVFIFNVWHPGKWVPVYQAEVSTVMSQV